MHLYYDAVTTSIRISSYLISMKKHCEVTRLRRQSINGKLSYRSNNVAIRNQLVLYCGSSKFSQFVLTYR